MYQHVCCRIKLLNLANLLFDVYSKKELSRNRDTGKLWGSYENHDRLAVSSHVCLLQTAI